jgi:divalent metal cation (Fe/Co/Zn/Cd) transporter
MFGLASAKVRTGHQLGSPVLASEGKVTLVDGLLATAVLVGLLLNAALGVRWADPAAGFVIVFYGLKEAREIFWIRTGNFAERAARTRRRFPCDRC